MTPDNDPGSAAACSARRGARVRRLGATPARRRRPDLRRHRVLDGSDDDRGRRLLPERRRQRGGAAAVLRGDVPGRRGRCHVLRAAGRADVAALGRPDAAGLHVRHQGPRADDRPGHGDQAPAEVDPRGAAGGVSGEGPDLHEGPAGGAPGRGLADVPGRAGAARRAQPAGLDPAPVPQVGLPVDREPGADRGRRGAARRAGRSRSSSATARGSTRRTSSGRRASSPSGTSRS